MYNLYPFDYRQKRRFHRACKDGEFEKLKQILVAIPDVAKQNEAIMHHDEQKNAAFHMAIQNGHGNIVQYILDKSSPDLRHKLLTLKTPLGETALHLAIKNRYSEIIKNILQNVAGKEKSDLARLTDNEGNTLLHLSSLLDHQATVALLLESFSGDELMNYLCEENNSQKTALMLARDKEHKSTADFLEKVYMKE